MVKNKLINGTFTSVIQQHLKKSESNILTGMLTNRIKEINDIKLKQ